MDSDAAAIRTYFAKLGLEPEIADIYLALHAQGPQTISALSRNARVERTRIYRLIDQLLDSGLIEVETGTKRAAIKAAPIANLRILITKREQELQSLQDELSMVERLLGRNQLASPAARVQFYQGREGAKQMLWNVTKAGGEVIGILYEPLQRYIDTDFYGRWVETCNRSGLRFRTITGEHYDRQMVQHGARQTARPAGSAEHLKHWQSRSVSPDVFPVTHSQFTFGDVTAYYLWRDNEIFGIEIYNHDIAAAQGRQFELLWEKLSHTPAEHRPADSP